MEAGREAGAWRPDHLASPGWRRASRPGDRRRRSDSPRLRGGGGVGLGRDGAHSRRCKISGSGPWAGTQLPDHGEAWRLPWSVLEESAESGTMECTGRVLPWKLHRRIELTERAVRMAYTFSNEGQHPMYAYWCSHPLFRYEAGMEIGVEGGDATAHLAEGTSAKRFLRRGSVDRVRLSWKSGPAIEIAWDSDVTPYVGVWACNGDLGGIGTSRSSRRRVGVTALTSPCRLRCSRRARSSGGGWRSGGRPSDRGGRHSPSAARRRRTRTASTPRTAERPRW